MFMKLWILTLQSWNQIFWDNWVNIMAADALVPSVARPSTAMSIDCIINMSLASLLNDF